MRVRSALALACVASLTIGAASLARAQDAGTPTESAPPPAELTAATHAEDALEDEESAATPPEHEALIDSTHVTELAQQTRTALREARPLARPDPDVLRITRELPGREAESARLTSPARLAQISRMSQRELTDLRQEWRTLRAGYQEWQDVLAARADVLEAARTNLVDLRRTWRALRDAVEADPDRDDARLARIVTSLEQVRLIATVLDRERDVAQSLEDRVSQLVIASDDVSDDIRDALAAYRERLLVRDRSPLWQGLDADVTDPDDLPWAAELRAQGTLLAEQTPGLLRLAILIAVLALGIEALARRTRVTSEGIAPVRPVADEPIASALVLGLLASGLVVSHAPVLLGDAVSVVLLVPVLWLLWPRVPPALHVVLGIVAAYVIVDRIEGTMNDGSAARRVVSLLESLIVGGALLRWARSMRAASEPTLRSARALARIGGAVLAAAAVAHVLGYSFLGTVLVRGTAFALGGALSLAMAFAVLDALTVMLLASPWLQRSNGVRAHRELILTRLRRALALALSLAWAVLVLGGYGLATPVFAWIDEALHAHSTFGTVEFSAGALLEAVLVLVASWILMRSVIFVLELDLLPRLSLEPGVAGAVAGLTRYVLAGTGLILALATLGIDASQIALVAGALGVGVGFGLQGIVANFIAGLVLMLERPVRLGDRIEVGLLNGHVERIGLRSSTVRGDDGAEVIVPNETLIGREVVNWTLSDRKRRVEIPIGVAYGTDPRRVLDIVTRAVAAQEDVLAQDSGAADPMVQFTAFGPSSLDFVVRFWTADDDHGHRLKSIVGIAVLDALIAAKIEIPFPQQDVRVRKLAPEPAHEEGRREGE